MAGRWYYARGGRRFGPFQLEQVRQMAASGLLSPLDMVLDEEGAGQWASAGTVPGLFPAEAGPAPAPAQAEAGGDRAAGRRCPHCHAALGGVADAFCPECRRDLSEPPQGRREAEGPPRGSGVRARPDRLEGRWYLIIWLSLLVPWLGPWLAVLLSSSLYYLWRRDYPLKARAANRHGWLAFLTAHAACCSLLGLGWWADQPMTGARPGPGAPPAPPPAGTFRKDPGAVLQYRGKNAPFALWLPPETWEESEEGKGPGAEVAFARRGGGAFALVAAGPSQARAEALRDSVLGGLREQDKGAVVTGQEHRLVNGFRVLCLTVDLTSGGAAATYHAYLYCDGRWAYQVSTLAGRDRFDELKPEMERFLNGFVPGAQEPAGP